MMGTHEYDPRCTLDPSDYDDPTDEELHAREAAQAPAETLYEREDEDEDLELVNTSWVPCNADDAAWLIGRILSAREEATRIEAQAQILLHRARRRETRLLERFGPDIEQIALRELTAATPAGQPVPKSWATLQGSVRWQRLGGGVVVNDAAACARWAAENDCLSAIRLDVRAQGAEAISLARAANAIGVHTEPSIMKTPLREHLQRTGELPGGCNLAPERREMRIHGPKEAK